MKFKTILLVLLACLCAVLSACGDATATESIDVPDGCVRTENDTVDYSFCYLSAWELDRNDGMIGIKCNIAERGTIAYASISTMAFTLEDSSMLANAYWDSYREDLTEMYGDKLNILSEKAETSLGGVVANRNRYTVALSDVTYSFDQVICIRNGVVYLVTLTAPELGYETAVPCMETVISTFAFK